MMVLYLCFILSQNCGFASATSAAIESFLQTGTTSEYIEVNLEL